MRAKVDEAVRIRLISEVPLGAHLSGGIDSSVVTALMARHSSGPVRTFSIGFHERAYDERAHARKVSERYGTRHEEFVLEPDPAAMIDELAAHFGEPFADPAAIPTWHLARMTRRHVTVALNGDGGDEAFAGYQRHAVDPLADLLGRFPAFLRTGLPNLLARLLPRRADLPPERDVAAALRRLSPRRPRNRGRASCAGGSYFMADEKAGRGCTARTSRHACGRTRRRPGCARCGRVRRLVIRWTARWPPDSATYLPGALLPKVDRMTMAHSLEARSLLLDHEVLELAATLPVSFKVRGRTTKRILRDAFADLLPPGIGARGKMGFGVPLGPWFRGPLRGWLSDTLSASGPLSEWFEPAELADLEARHLSGREDLGKRLWALVMLAAWRRWIG
ncbi:MAG: asparagine synthase-related protein [Kiritimatiellia bacterium]